MQMSANLEICLEKASGTASSESDNVGLISSSMDRDGSGRVKFEELRTWSAKTSKLGDVVANSYGVYGAVDIDNGISVLAMEVQSCLHRAAQTTQDVRVIYKKRVENAKEAYRAEARGDLGTAYSHLVDGDGRGPRGRG